MTVALLGSLECAQGILKMGPCSAKQHGQSEFCVESAHDTTRSSGTAAAEDLSDTSWTRCDNKRGRRPSLYLSPDLHMLLYHFRGAIGAIWVW